MKTEAITNNINKLKKKEPAFIKEFKEFINRGSVIDLAVGVVIGGAFTSIVNSLVNDVVMPIVSMTIGGFDFSNLKITIPAYAPGIEPATINYGSFITAVINFLIIALVIFIMVKALNKMKKKAAPAPVEDKAAAKVEDSQTEVLKEIRDLLKKDAKKSK